MQRVRLSIRFARQLLWLALLLTACSGNEHKRVQRALVGRGRVGVVGDATLMRLKPAGTALVPLAQAAPVERALRGNDPARLIDALSATHLSGLLLDTQQQAPPRSLLAQLTGFARIKGLQGVYFTRGVALYALDPVRTWSPALRAGLAEVARRLVAGAVPPRTSSFPEPVRRLDPVEVMVLLRSGPHPRLWRSARGSSFARALLTAAAVARQRWIERSQALGGNLHDMLPQLDVEVALLQDDGEIGERTANFVDRVVLPVHGVGYERKGGWHYLLPEATRTAGRKPSRAYAQLFSDDGLPEDSLDNSDLRLYRLAVHVIGVSPAPGTPEPEPKDGLSEVASPAQVLEH